MSAVNIDGYEITHATYANQDNTSVILYTNNRGLVAKGTNWTKWNELLDSGVLISPYSYSTDDLKDHLVHVRQAVEYGGITFNGMTIPSDEKTEGRIGRAYTKAINDPNYTIDNWTTDGGATSFTLTASMIIAIGDALDAHIQKCFSVNVAVTAQIVSGALTTKTQVEAAFAAGMAA